MIRGLERYHAINSGEAVAKFQIAKRIEAERHKDIKSAIEEHSRIKKEFKSVLKKEGKDTDILAEKPPEFSFLDLKIDILLKMLESCNFCERKCGVNRYKAAGFCGCGVQSYYSAEFLHFGEESELIPSHTIFFNRCSFRCVFCQNWTIVYRDDRLVDPIRLARRIDIRHRQGSKNVNFVGGNPDQHSHTILKILKHVKSNVPVVWNSNMYHSMEIAEIIEDVVDVWLGDFKYGNDACAKKYSNADNYWEIVTRNFLMARKSCEIIIRHLVLPNHIECCTKRIIEWVSENMGRDIRFNLMFQYYPAYRAREFKEISRMLRKEEIDEALKIAADNLTNLV